MMQPKILYLNSPIFQKSNNFLCVCNLPEVSWHEHGLVPLGHNGGGGEGGRRVAAGPRVRLQLVDRLEVERVGRVASVELSAPLAHHLGLLLSLGADGGAGFGGQRHGRRLLQVDAVLLLAEAGRVRRLETAVAAVGSDLLELSTGAHGDARHVTALAQAVRVVGRALETCCQLKRECVFIYKKFHHQERVF